ncbi:hypothetical protein ACFPOE_07805 [Caenimonas terrae]|uniref:Uncharacterized protein n=1 Tax=Caenimonas terrae TaxID=696074 RepID=A0ABW0NBZ8_9BURK
MQGLLTFLVRLVLLAAGLVFAASLAVVVALALTLWSVRYAWARLTGRAVSPFVVHVRARRGFENMTRRPAAVRPAPEIGDIIDVEAKPPRNPG